MLGIIEIVLTYKAWNKGWKGRALLPWLGAFVLIFLIALSIRVGGGDAKAMPAFGLLIDVLLITALALMVRNAPAEAQHDTGAVSSAADVPQNSIPRAA